MTQYMSVSKAARLLGTNRSALQTQIRQGQLNAFEGMLSTQELQDVYPQLCFPEEKILEQAAERKSNAVQRRQTAETLMMTREDLFREWKLASQENAELKQRLETAQQGSEHYLHVIVELKTKLENLEAQCDHRQKAMLSNVLTWLLKKVEA